MKVETKIAKKHDSWNGDVYLTILSDSRERNELIIDV